MSKKVVIIEISERGEFEPKFAHKDEHGGVSQDGRTWVPTETDWGFFKMKTFGGLKEFPAIIVHGSMVRPWQVHKQPEGRQDRRTPTIIDDYLRGRYGAELAWASTRVKSGSGSGPGLMDSLRKVPMWGWVFIGVLVFIMLGFFMGDNILQGVF